MNTSRITQLQEVVSLSRDMLAQAQDDQWQAVIELEAQRRTLVEACFRDPAGDAEAASVAAAIREILSLNQQLEQLGRQSRDEMASHLSTRQTGRTANAAYQSCAR